ncbi:MAG TPA: type II toxin-antitoxin system Phd/YefM family antitoxin [Terriglobales bacterium]|nr:type II toxin-antitoxin system Phd/YefM family antitoxin [Terriglobales bacterium]
MRSVNIAELKNRLSAYLALVKAGEEIIVRDRKAAVARLLPLPAGLSPAEQALVAAGQLRLPTEPWDVDQLLRIPVGKVSRAQARAAAADVRGESR